MSLGNQRAVWLAALATLALAACASPAADGPAKPVATSSTSELKLNQLQVVGTHNSYKMAIPDVEMALIAKMSPTAAITLDYSHEPLDVQLDKGARQLELDPSDDPDGGLYSTPLARKMLQAQGVTPPPYDLSAMAKPGIKVIHVADIDYRSQCLLFVDCLKAVKAWSDKHPNHAPILLMINPKSDGIKWPGAAKVRPWKGDSFERMETEIRSVFPLKQIITPDEVRGTHATLREGAMAGGWPTLAKSRGRVIFAMDLSPEENVPYAVGHPSLKGRLAFMNTNPDTPEAAYFTMNEPIEQFALIQERVRQGFLVRTRADADTREARSGDTKRRETAFATGAQYVSTDYQDPEPRFKTGYFVALPGGGVARCNPVNAPAGCAGKAE